MRPQLDRTEVTGVSLHVRLRRGALVGAVLLALAPACGKDKKGDTTPGGGAAGGVSGGGELGEAGGGPGGDDGFGTLGPGSGGAAGGGAAGGGAAGGAAGGGEPGIRPPGVDLSPAEQKRLVETHLRKGRAAIASASKDPDVAISEAQQALAADETSVEAMVLLAHGNFLKGYDDQAEDILDKAFKRGGRANKQAHFVMGLIYDRTNRPEKAQASYEAALKVDPNYTSALMNLGVHYLKNKRWTDAVQVYERLSGELRVQTPAVWTNLGSAYRGRSADFNATDIRRRNELLAKAEQSYKQAITARKDYANAYYNLGLLYLDADPYPEGQGDMDRLKRLNRSKTYFAEYRGQPGADHKLADEQVSVVQKLVDKEEARRKKAEETAAKKKAKEEADRKKAEEKKKKGDKPDDDEGFQ
jgi:tetratricopeptide (TPR) repeat protein